MHRFLEARVSDYMTRSVVTVDPAAPLGELESQFSAYDFNGFPVVDADTLAGVVTKFDLMKVFIFTPSSVVPQYEELMKLRAREIMTRDVLTFRPEAPLTRVLQTMVDFRVKSFPVVDNGRVVGIIARSDIVRALREACGA